MKSRLYHLHALSPVHIGTGQGDGLIDLPLAREVTTGLPIVPGSGLKGVLRDELRPPDGDDEQKRQHKAMFGPDPTRASEHEGAVRIGDGLLLCLPVRALRGTFAWLTSPMVLFRYQRDLRALDLIGKLTGPPQPPSDRALLHPAGAVFPEGGRADLEDLNLECHEDAGAAAWAQWIAEQVFPDDPDWQTIFQQRFAVVADVVFDTLCTTAMEIRTRVALDPDKRTVKEGPWYEECLPPESICWGIAAAGYSRDPDTELAPDELLSHLAVPERLQIGGGGTVGRGQVRWLLVPAREE